MISILLKSTPNKHGQHAVQMDISYQYQRVRKTLFSIHPKHWDPKNNQVKKTHPQAYQLNAIITDKQAKITNYIIECERLKTEPNIKAFLKGTTSDPGKRQKPTLLKCMDDYLQYLYNNKQYGSYRKSKSVYVKLYKYLNFKDIPIESCNRQWQEAYFNYCGSKLNNKVSTQLKDWKTIVAAVNRYVNSDIIDRNPFKKFIKKPEPVVKKKLTTEQINKIAHAPLLGNLAITRDIFMFQFYARGMRIGDVLTLKTADISDSITYKMGKSSKPHKIKIIPPLKAIIDRYYNAEQTYLFPYIDKLPEDPMSAINYIGSKTSLVNKNLRRISRIIGLPFIISTHISRHSFAKMADSKGIDLTAIQHMMGHSSLSQTKYYIHQLRIEDELDDIADEIFGS